MSLTQQQIDLCREDTALSREDFSKKYNIMEGGEHPVATLDAYHEDGSRERIGNVCDFKTAYCIWAYGEIKEISSRS